MNCGNSKPTLIDDTGDNNRSKETLTKIDRVSVTAFSKESFKL